MCCRTRVRIWFSAVGRPYHRRHITILHVSDWAETSLPVFVFQIQIDLLNPPDAILSPEGLHASRPRVDWDNCK